MERSGQGMLEYWNDGMSQKIKYRQQDRIHLTPFFHRSSIPVQTGKLFVARP
jgi:hypothetical protein